MVNFNIVTDDYQQDSTVLYTSVSNKPFGSIIKNSPTNFMFLKPFNSKFSDVEVWLTDQNRR